MSSNNKFEFVFANGQSFWQINIYVLVFQKKIHQSFTHFYENRFPSLFVGLKRNAKRALCLLKKNFSFVFQPKTFLFLNIFVFCSLCTLCILSFTIQVQVHTHSRIPRVNMWYRISIVENNYRMILRPSAFCSVPFTFFEFFLHLRFLTISFWISYRIRKLIWKKNLYFVYDVCVCVE